MSLSLLSWQVGAGSILLIKQDLNTPLLFVCCSFYLTRRAGHAALRRTAVIYLNTSKHKHA